MEVEKISYAKTVYGEEEINAVLKCLNESTQMGKYAREFENNIANLFSKNNININVKNYGKGINEENLKKITNPFFRIKDKHNNKKSGFGMGLSITKKIIDAHNGELIIKSTLNKSTTFSISLSLN